MPKTTQSPTQCQSTSKMNATTTWQSSLCSSKKSKHSSTQYWPRTTGRSKMQYSTGHSGRTTRSWCCSSTWAQSSTWPPTTQYWSARRTEMCKGEMQLWVTWTMFWRLYASWIKWKGPFKILKHQPASHNGVWLKPIRLSLQRDHLGFWHALQICLHICVNSKHWLISMQIVRSFRQS